MKKNLLRFSVLLSFGFSASLASELAIYRSFAEVKDQITLQGSAFDWSLPKGTFEYLLLTSVFLDYPGKINSSTIFPVTGDLLKAFEGKEVIIKTDKEEFKAKVIDADQGLFEVNGRFMQFNRNQVVYPSLDGVSFVPKLRWSLENQGQNQADLYYITSGLNWQPRYTLKVDNIEGKPFDPKVKIDALADIYNLTSSKYDASVLKLFAGDARVIDADGFGAINANRQGNLQNQRLYDQMNFQAAAQKVEIATQETGGLQAFTYPKPAMITANATTTLPFITTSVKLDRWLEYSASFRSDSQTNMAMKRIYNLKPADNLPAGVFTVREDGMLLGQASINDTPKNENAKLTLGDDFDLRLKRTVSILERRENLLSGTLIRYKVTYSVTNTKNRPVNVQLKETFGANYTIESNNLPNFKWENGTSASSTTLNPGTKLEGSYTVVYKSA